MLLAGSHSTTKNQPIRAYEIFVSDFLQGTRRDIGKQAALKEDVDKRWHELPRLRKQIYENRARQERARMARLCRMNFKEWACADEARQLRKRQRTTVQRTLVRNTLCALRTDSAWKAGAQVDCLQSALRPTAVEGLTYGQARERCSDMTRW